MPQNITNPEYGFDFSSSGEISYSFTNSISEAQRYVDTMIHTFIRDLPVDCSYSVSMTGTSFSKDAEEINVELDFIWEKHDDMDDLFADFDEDPEDF